MWLEGYFQHSYVSNVYRGVYKKIKIKYITPYSENYVGMLENRGNTYWLSEKISNISSKSCWKRLEPVGKNKINSG